MGLLELDHLHCILSEGDNIGTGRETRQRRLPDQQVQPILFMAEVGMTQASRPDRRRQFERQVRIGSSGRGRMSAGSRPDKAYPLARWEWAWSIALPRDRRLADLR
jgi:hypothetical protein